jgi:hypothetical protein
MMPLRSSGIGAEFRVTHHHGDLPGHLMLLIVLATIALGWVAMLVVVLGLCMFAARGDRALSGASAMRPRAAQPGHRFRLIA